MSKTATITINGRLYDAITGMPVTHQAKHTAHVAPATHRKAPAPVPAAPAHKPMRAFSDIAPKQHAAQAPGRQVNARALHQRTQRSQTLNRTAAKKTAIEHTPLQPEDTPRSPLITRHRPAVIKPIEHTAQTQQPAAKTEQSPAVTHMHPVVAKALQHKAASQPAAPVSGKELKELLIKERLAEVEDEPKDRKKSFFARQPKLATILVSSLSLLILGGYLTYINLSNISMRVAASKAGINASFPNYKPDGYSLNGPITYAPGEVAINYSSNSNDTNFKLTQRASNWDSQAVLDNFVTKQTDTYLTFQERGITVYTFNNKAAWINRGTLYTIDGTASLSSEQVLRIATSL